MPTEDCKYLTDDLYHETAVLKEKKMDKLEEIKERAKYNYDTDPEDRDWLIAELTKAKRVWDELAVTLGCASPDGSVELEQVRYLQEQLQDARAEISNLNEEIKERK